MAFTETIKWKPPEPRPDHCVMILVCLPNNIGVCEGFWNNDEQCWSYGIDNGFYPDDEGCDAFGWAEIPEGPTSTVVAGRRGTPPKLS